MKTYTFDNALAHWVARQSRSLCSLCSLVAIPEFFSSLPGVGFGLCLLAVISTGCQPQKHETGSGAQALGDTLVFPADSPQLAALRTEPVSPMCPGNVSLAGRLLWNEDATVRVFSPFAGIVRTVSAPVGGTISNGAPLCEIQSADFGQALADARKAESDFRRADRNLTRVRELFEHGATPRRELESAEADFESAKAEKERTTSKLAIYGSSTTASSQSFILPSPLAGTVVERNVNPGQEVRPDQMLANTPQFTAPLFVITDPNRLWIQIDATELDLPYFQQGQEFTFTSRALPSQTFTGRVDVISDSVDASTRTIKIRGSLDNARRLLKAEMFVTVNVPKGQIASATVPARAVFLKGDKHYVFVEAQTGRFVRREVLIGPEENEQVFILAGARPGQRVVTDGCLLLQQTLQ